MGKIVVLSGPSGSGKTTICHRLLKLFPDFAFSVSATTRLPRKGERNGMDYHFFSKSEFQERIGRGELIEWEEVHGALYGTLKKTVEDALQKPGGLILDVDPKGALNIKKMYPDSLLIFLEAGNDAILTARLRKRSTESESQIAKRLERIREEAPLASQFDCIIVNDDLEQAVDKIAKKVAGILE